MADPEVISDPHPQIDFLGGEIFAGGASHLEIIINIPLISTSITFL